MNHSTESNELFAALMIQRFDDLTRRNSENFRPESRDWGAFLLTPVTRRHTLPAATSCVEITCIALHLAQICQSRWTGLSPTLPAVSLENG